MFHRFAPLSSLRRHYLTPVALSFFTALLFNSSNAFAEQNLYQEKLKRHALEQALHKSEQWLALMHYQEGQLFSRFESYVDAPDFFLSKTGKHDPKAELEATITGFFDENHKDPYTHPQCRFRARFLWLKDVLKVDEDKIPSITCERFETWRTSLAPVGLTLVFPTAYMNNPASMFGHTLLRIDGENQNEDSRLLAYTTSYGAETGNDGGFVFAFKGLFGGYYGFFSILPYYKQVERYGDLENRDIWEYELQFSQKEIDLVLAHLWELRGTFFYYYFFDENCSFHLLSLLDVGRPSLALTKDFPFWALPPDTVRSVVKRKGLIRKTVYRPSLYSRIEHVRKTLSKESKRQAIALTKSDTDVEAAIAAIPEDEKAQTLELAFDYLRYQTIKNKKGTAKKSRAHTLLAARSKIDNQGEPAQIPAPPRPDEGHGTLKIALAGGQRDAVPFSELTIRPVFHDLLDPQAGYVRGAQIKFFETTVRHFEGKNLRLESHTPLDIVSLSPRNDFFSPLSWRINTSVNRRRFSDKQDELVSGVEGGAGLSYKLTEGLLIYSLAELDFEHSSHFDDNTAFGTGSNTGLFLDFSSSSRLFLGAKLHRYFLGDVHTRGELAFVFRQSIGEHIAFRAQASRTRSFDQYFNEWSIGIETFL